MLFCPRCGTRLPSMVASCPACRPARNAEDTAPGRRLSVVRATGPDTITVRRRPTATRWPLRIGMVLVPVLAVMMTIGTVIAWRRADDAEAARHYAAAEAALVAGDAGEAMRAFGLAGDYRDAADRRAEIDAGVRGEISAAAAAAAAGNYEEAIGTLRPVVAAYPDHREAGLLLGQSVALRQAELDATIRTGTRTGDWLAVERALEERVTLSPADQTSLTLLADMRANRSPLVFARDRALYLVAPDGSDERLVTDAVPVGWPAWSPDRRWVAFLSASSDHPQYAADLYVVAPDGTGLRRLAGGVLRSRWPTWSPEGGRILYTSVAGFTEALPGGDPGTISTRMVDVATGVETDLTTGVADYAGAGVWSPDGRQVAVVTRPFVLTLTETFDLGPSEVRVIDLATGEVRDVSTGRQPTAWRLGWDPSGAAIFILTLSEDASSMSLDRTALYRLDLATGEIETLEDSATDVTLPVWSPDGRRAAFVVDFRTVRIWDGDGTSRDVPLEGSFYESVSWSPDGSRLLVPVAESGRSSLILMADGSDAVVTAPIDFSSDWSHGGPPLWTSRTVGTGASLDQGGMVAVPATPVASPDIPSPGT